MNFKEYQTKSRVTALYPNMGNDFTYPVLGLMAEAGEVADKIKKHIRDDGIHTPAALSSEQKKELAKELGDVLWYISQLVTELDGDLGEVAQMNIDKLYSRMDRNVIGGSGDNR